MRKELWKTKRRRQLRLVHLVDGEREAEVVVVVGGAVASRWARISRGSGHREQRCDADGEHEHVGQSSGGHSTVPRFEQKEFLTVLPPRAAAFFLYASLATRRTRAVARRLDGHSDGHFSTGTSRLADRDCSRSHPCRAWRGCACQPSLLGWLRYYSHWFMHTPTSLGSPFAVHTRYRHPFIVFILTRTGRYLYLGLYIVSSSREWQQVAHTLAVWRGGHRVDVEPHACKALVLGIDDGVGLDSLAMQAP